MGAHSPDGDREHIYREEERTAPSDAGSAVRNRIAREYVGEVTSVPKSQRGESLEVFPMGTNRILRRDLAEYVGRVVAVLVDFDSPIAYRPVLLAEVGIDFVGTPPGLTLDFKLGPGAIAVSEDTAGLLDFRTANWTETELFKSEPRR